jgi:hypothetical protein
MRREEKVATVLNHTRLFHPVSEILAFQPKYIPTAQVYFQNEHVGKFDKHMGT